jgi:cytochrome c oxidase subunit I+III
VFTLFFIGMQVTFLPMHLTGLMGMPRRVFTYLPGQDLEITNFISTVGAFILAAAILIFLVDLARNFRFTVADNAGNVYRGGTLEWLPTGLYSTRSIPIIRSRQPLWDQPDLADKVKDGRYFLPNAPTGRRETMITSPLRAEPQYIEIMPGPSPWPFFAAVFTAGFFLLMTVKAHSVAVFCGIVALLCVLRWLWETDRKVDPAEVDVGAGIMLPTYATGPSTHGWWAIMVLLTVVTMIWVMTLFAYAYVFGVHPEFWSVPPSWTSAAWVIGFYAIGAALVLFARWLLAKGTTLWTPPTLMLFAAPAILLGLFADYRSWRSVGFDPELSSQAAIVHAFLAQQAMLAVIVVLMVLYMAARASRGLITTPRNNSFDLVTIFTVYTALQGCATALVTRAVAVAG